MGLRECYEKSVVSPPSPPLSKLSIPSICPMGQVGHHGLSSVHAVSQHSLSKLSVSYLSQDMGHHGLCRCIFIGFICYDDIRHLKKFARIPA